MRKSQFLKTFVPVVVLGLGSIYVTWWRPFDDTASDWLHARATLDSCFALGRVQDFEKDILNFDKLTVWVYAYIHVVSILGTNIKFLL